MMKAAVRKKECLDQTYPMTRFAPSYPTNSNIFIFKCHFSQVKYEWTKRKLTDLVNLQFLLKIIKYPAG